MKKLLIAVLVTSISLSVFGYDIFSYVPINGNAKSYTCTEYSVTSKFGDYFRTPVNKVTHALNEFTQEVESAEYTPRDVLINKIKTSYDASGNVTGQTGLNSADETIWRTVYSYKNGIKVDMSQYGKDNSLKGKTIFACDGDLVVDETSYDSYGALIWKIIYKYDDARKLISESHYFADGSLEEEVIYKYTATGAIESITTNDVMSGYKQEVFRYSSNGQLNEITTYGAGNKVVKRLVIKYDDKGNVSKLSDYNVAEKFGTTVNELVYMADYTYKY